MCQALPGFLSIYSTIFKTLLERKNYVSHFKVQKTGPPKSRVICPRLHSSLSYLKFFLLPLWSVNCFCRLQKTSDLFTIVTIGKQTWKFILKYLEEQYYKNPSWIWYDFNYIIKRHICKRNFMDHKLLENYW